MIAKPMAREMIPVCGFSTSFFSCKSLNMPLIELEREQYFCIYYDTDEAWLYVDWTGYQTSASVMRGCNHMVDWLVHYQTDAVLNDNTCVLGIWSGAAEWGATDWFPRMKAAGMKHFAWVSSPSRLSQVSTDATLSQMDAEPFGVKVFNTIAEARDWLHERRAQVHS
jgi:hypothetical protein